MSLDGGRGSSDGFEGLCNFSSHDVAMREVLSLLWILFSSFHFHFVEREGTKDGIL